MLKQSDDPVSSSRRIARNAALRSFGEIVAKAASLVFFVAMARKLGTSEYGQFIFAMSFTGLILLPAGFGFEDLTTRDIAREHGRVHDYLSHGMAIKATSSVALLALAGLIVNLLDYPPEARAAVYIVGAGVAIESIGRNWHAAFQAYERIAFVSISVIVQRTLTSAAGLIAMAMGGRLVACSFAYLGGAIIGLATAWWAFGRFVVRPRIFFDVSGWWPLIRAGVPIGIATIMFTVLLRMDASLLGLLKGGQNGTEVGLYGAAFRVVEATMFITWSFTASVLPWLSRQQARGVRMRRGSEVAFKAITGVLLPFGLGFALLADPFIRLLYGDAYAGAVLPLQFLAVLQVFYGVNLLASTVLVALDRPGVFTRTVGVVTLQNIVMNLLLIPRYGADGAAFTAAVSAFVLGVVSLVRVSKVVGGIRPARAFGAPLAGGLAMAAVIVLSGAPRSLAAVLGVLAYALGFLVFERVSFPEDLRMLTTILRRRVPAPSTAAPLDPTSTPP